MLYAHTLESLAEQINVSLVKERDYQVRAAIQLATAKDLCKKQGIPFKKWVEDNVNRDYTWVLRLAKAGASKDEEQTTKCIEDLRAGTRQRMQKHKEAKIKEAVLQHTSAPLAKRIANVPVVPEAVDEDEADEARLSDAPAPSAIPGMQMKRMKKWLLDEVRPLSDEEVDELFQMGSG